MLIAQLRPSVSFRTFRCPRASGKPRTKHSNISKSGSPLLRDELGWREAKGISPCFGFGPGDRPHSSLITPPSLRGGWRADKAHGLERQAGDGTAFSRALGVKRHAPRLAARQRGIFGLRLSQR